MLHIVAIVHNIVQTLLDIMFMTYLICNQFFMLFCRPLIFSKYFFFKNDFNNNVRTSKSLDPDRARRFRRA